MRIIRTPGLSRGPAEEGEGTMSRGAFGRALQLVSLISLGLVVACGGSSALPAGTVPAASSISIVATPSPTMTARPTPSDGDAAHPTSSPSAASGPRPIVPGTFAPGTYATTAFQPPLSFSLGEGWSAFFPDQTEIFELDTTGGALAMMRVYWVIDPKSGQQVPGPDDLLGWLAHHPALVATKAKSVRIAGRSASSIDVRASSTQRLFWFSGEPFRLNTGDQARLYQLPLEGADLTIMVVALAGSSLADVLKAAGPVLDSLEVGSSS